MPYHAIIPFFAAIATLTLGVMVYCSKGQTTLGRVFSFLAITLVLWNLQWFVLYSVSDANLALRLVRVFRIGSYFMPPAILHLQLALRSPRSRAWYWMLLASYAAGWAFSIANAFNLVVSGLQPFSWGYYVVGDQFYELYGMFAFANSCAAIAVLVHDYRTLTAPRMRLQAKFWLAGALVGLPLGLTNLVPSYGISFYPLGSLGTAVWAGVVAYAIVRHRLMDIDLFVIRTAATLLASAAVVLPVASAAIWARHLPFGASSLLVIGCLMFAALASLSLFVRFRSYLEREVESSLFPARRAGRDAIRQLGAELLQLAHRNDLSRQVTARLMSGLGVNGIGLYLSTSAPGAFKLAGREGNIEAPEFIPTDGIIEADGNDDRLPRSDDTRLDIAAREFRWDAWVPIPGNGSCLGFIALGSKQSGAAIDDSEVTLVTVVAAQLAIALKNADYVHKIERQTAEIERLRKRLEAENVTLRAEVRAISQFKEIIGSSPALQRVLALVEQAAATDAAILVTGETGTGKELIARAVHERSLRRNGPFVSVNCAAIPPGLAESELFGHERGAFTDAVAARPGKFELADGGTIFLDEVAELPPALQSKLLRVLQERETQRVGGSKVRKLNFRVVAATNRNLQEEMRAQRFRSDLYYRLAEVPVHIPSLRERTADLPMLATFFLERAASTYQKPITGFTPDAMAALQRYSWPGNIRELQHVVARAALVCGGDVIKPEHLSDLAPVQPMQTLGKRLREEKLRQVEQALAQAGGNQAAAARSLGMSRSNFARLVASLGLKPPPRRTQ